MTDDIVDRRLAALSDGWLDGSGSCPSPASIEAARNVMRLFDADEIPVPRIYPTLEGAVRLEWTIGDADAALEAGAAGTLEMFVVGATSDDDAHHERISASDAVFLLRDMLRQAATPEQVTLRGAVESAIRNGIEDWNGETNPERFAADAVLDMAELKAVADALYRLAECGQTMDGGRSQLEEWGIPEAFIAWMLDGNRDSEGHLAPTMFDTCEADRD